MAKLIKVDGTEQDLGLEPSLEQLQAAVGGYLEAVNIPNEVMLVNEEGRLQGLPQNIKASLRACQTIVGDVVVCTPTEDGRLL
jgi:hypothetical protein